MYGTQDPVPIASWSCFYDASDDVESGASFVSSAPTFRATAAALSGVLHHFQWQYVVLVVDESRRLYADLAAHVVYAVADDGHFAIERVVRLNRGEASRDAENRLRVITATHARGTFSSLSVSPQ